MIPLKDDEVARQAKGEKVQGKGNSLQKEVWTGDISADSLCQNMSRLILYCDRCALSLLNAD